MKLIRCYIENFGGLHRYTVSFEDGLTVIHEPNGFGKTTLAEFIRAMFYGFPRAGKDLEKNLRLKYRPWQGGRYGGYLIFELGGKHYRIDRTFGDTPRQDHSRLLDESTHRESRDFSPADLGTQLFGMDSDSFLRSVYMPQTPISGPLSTDSLRAALGGLPEDSDDSASFEKALQRLKDKRTAYEHFRGTGGSIHDAQKQITALQNQLQLCRSKQPELEALTADIARLQHAQQLGEQSLNRIRNQLTVTSSALAEAALSHEYESLLTRSQNAQSRLQALHDRYPMGLPTRQALDTANDLIDDISLLQHSLQETPADDTAPPKKLHSSFLPLLILGILTAAAGVALLMLPALPTQLTAFLARYEMLLAYSTVIGGSCCGAAALSLIIGLFLQLKHSLRRQLLHNSPPPASLAQLAALQARLDDWNETYGLHINDRRSLNAAERDRETAQTLAQAAQDTARALESFLAKYGKPGSPPSATHDDLERLKTAEQQLLRRLNATNTQLLQLQQRQKLLREETDRIPRLTDELSRITAKKAEDIERRRLLDETAAFLQQARESLSRNYLGSVQSHFTQYLNRLTGEEPDRVAINSDLDVQLERAGSARSMTLFSAGQTDLVQLCMRLSLSDALFKGERCFMILDDPFVNLDDAYMVQALELLHDLSKDRQIIYLVCNASRTP